MDTSLKTANGHTAIVIVLLAYSLFGVGTSAAEEPAPDQADAAAAALKPAEELKAAEAPAEAAAPADQPAAADPQAPPANPQAPAEPPAAAQPPAQPAAPQPPAQPKPAAPPQPVIIDSAADGRFTMSVKDMAITELLQMIAAKYRVSIVSSSDVAGKVSVNFYDVTLEEALDAILTVNGLTFTRRGKVIHIHKPIPEAAPPAPPAPGKVTKTFELAYANADDVMKVLSELKGESGKVVKSAERNIVVVCDNPDIIESMAAVVVGLDRKPRQVLITAWVMELGDSDLRKLGVNWASLDSMKFFEFSSEVSAKKGRIDGGQSRYHDFHYPLATSVDLRAGILSDNQFSLLLSFFDTLSESKVVSEPRVMTQENKPANIVVGTVVPIPLFDFAQESGTRILSGFQDQRIGTEVTVTPRVHESGHITLDINPKVEQIVDYIVVNGEKQRPIVSTRQAKTTVMVRSGDIVAIGGLRDESHSLSGGQVPLLGSIPVLGWLFKNRTRDSRTTDLTIFIRPELFDEDNPLSLDEKTMFEALKPRGRQEDGKAGGREEGTNIEQ